MRVRVRVQGIVQGVGFRPFVYRLAQEEGLAGYVLNDERGVVLEAEGPRPALERLIERMRSEAPPLAVIDHLAASPVEPVGGHGFEIRESARGADIDTVIAPDTATCEDCLRELFEPDDRRYRYPFVNCTNCGPRLTIVEGVPYDRALTTMSTFTMCARCEAEYRDPANRRFHAQPNACPDCGPRARLLDGAGRELTDAGACDPVDAAAAALVAGAILAVKGIGGYHLAADATAESAVAALRARKHRERKPFALMVAGLEVAAGLVELGEQERALAVSAARPIVLCVRREPSPVAASVAPGAPELGLMLPYTPLHHLLLADFTARAGRPAILVMTSGNRSDEPIAYEDDDALGRLAGIADAFLVHDRPIRSRVDDSVARAAGPLASSASGPRRLTLRRSRGYVPAPIALPVPASRPLLAVGAELKSTFCLARGGRAWVSHHIGDLEHYAALVAFRDGVGHYERLFDVWPELVAHDLHPGYASTAYAQERAGVELVGVQHHHAHLAACLAEHGRGPEVRAVGAIYDGTGYGTDGTVWGGEVLIGGLTGFERVAALRPVRMPGGEAAIRQPWRMACAWLAEALHPGASTGLPADPPPLPATLAGAVSERDWGLVAQVGRDPRLSPLTTSMGRLFDAVAALCGIAPEAVYEGQAAVELMAAAAGARPRAYELAVLEAATCGTPVPAVRWTLDPRALIAAVAADLAAGVAVAEVAAGFHAAVARATGRVCALAAGAGGLDTVVLSGGVFQNQLLLGAACDRLTAAGLAVLVPEQLPANDGGIAFGQAAVAAALAAG